MYARMPALSSLVFASSAWIGSRKDRSVTSAMNARSTDSLPAKHRRAALRHRGDALAEVGGVLEALLLGALAFRGGADLRGQPAAQRLADRGDRERARAGDLGRERARRAAQLFEPHEPIAQPDCERALAVEPGARVEQLERTLLSDGARKCHREAEAMMEAEPR